jgi:ribosomal protein L35
MFKSKSRGAISKKIKLTNGGDKSKGKFKIGTIGRCHRMIKKNRQRVLNGKKKTMLNMSTSSRFKTML